MGGSTLAPGRPRPIASPPMAEDEPYLIGRDEVAYRLELTPPQLKITYTALKSLLDDLGHDEGDVARIVRDVLAKLPGEHDVRSIQI